jgi:hypothetical protein
VLGQAIVVARSTYRHFRDFLEDSPQYEWFLSKPVNCQAAFDLFLDRAENVGSSRAGLDSTMWLHGTRRRLCRLPQDRIYSILGLTSETFRNTIDIDYTQPVEEVFKAVVKASIKESGSLDIISYSQHSVWHLESPSWMPDWRLKSRVVLNIFPMSRGLWPPRVTFSDDLSELTVKGTHVATVTDIDLETRLISKFDRSSNARFDKADKDQVYLSSSTFWEVEVDVLEELLAPATRRWALDDFHPTSLEGLNMLLKVLELKWKPERLDTAWYEKTSLPQDVLNHEKPNKSDLLDFNKEIQESVASRTIVATDKDFLGIAPDFTEYGDVIYVMSGCYTPVVLRPQGEGRFRFIGDIFLGTLKPGENEMFPQFTSDRFPDLHDIVLV